MQYYPSEDKFREAEKYLMQHYNVSEDKLKGIERLARNESLDNAQFLKYLEIKPPCGDNLNPLFRHWIIKTTYKCAREYTGEAQKKMLVRLLHFPEFFGRECVETECVSHTNNGLLTVDDLAWLGITAVAKVNPELSTAYLNRKINDPVSGKRFQEHFLHGLGISYNDINLKDLCASENIVSWIPLVKNCITLVKYDISNSQELIRNSVSSERIEQFFSSFPYESALEYLVDALRSEVCLENGDKLSEVFLGKEVRAGGSVCAGGWKGSYDITRMYEYDAYLTTYRTRYLVAEGAVKSLEKIKEASPALTNRIDAAINDFKAKPKKVVTYNELRNEVEIDSIVREDDHQSIK